MTTLARVHLRWLIRRDMPEVVAIEAGCPDPWSEDGWLSLLRHRNCIGFVAEAPGTELVVGAMAYRLHRSRVELVRLAVHPDWRRRGIGAALLAKLDYKLDSHRRHMAFADVPGAALDAQLLLRSAGWRAVNVDHDGDAYRMVRRAGG